MEFFAPLFCIGQLEKVAYCHAWWWKADVWVREASLPYSVGNETNSKWKKGPIVYWQKWHKRNILTRRWIPPAATPDESTWVKVRRSKGRSLCCCSFHGGKINSHAFNEMSLASQSIFVSLATVVPVFHLFAFQGNKNTIIYVISRHEQKLMKFVKRWKKTLCSVWTTSGSLF